MTHTRDPKLPSTDVIDRPPTLQVASVELQVLEGADVSLRVRLPAGTARVGTAETCKVRLHDPTVSRFHCELRVEPAGIRIVDSGSTNGTFVEGVRVYDASLLAGTTIRVGTTSLRVEIGTNPLYVPLWRESQFGGVIGESVEMRRIFAVMDRVAKADTTVLIQGETGTGKEQIARAIHEASTRALGAFTAVDCGAIASHLIESELFGHARGAFTGAVGERKGLFEEAHGGTLFLDEIGELPLALQPKLLRALETREIRRVGENVPRKFDVRVLAATNRPLAQSINEGTFREDLYYRLAVVEIMIPPLRARREDIAPLARHFFERFAGVDRPMPAELLTLLMARAWPGNVRELRNFIDRSVSLGWSSTGAHDDVIPETTLSGVEAFVPTHLGLKDARAAWTDQFEKHYVTALLRRTGGNVTRAAAIAGVNRRSLQRLMVDHGLRSDDADRGSDD